jgi:hypothetical protein
MKRCLALLGLLLVSSTSIGQSTFPDLPKALVQFNGVPKGGTYAQSDTTITVTPSTTYIEDPRVPGYNFRAGDGVYLDFISGGAADTYKEIVSATENGTSFTITVNDSATRSGNVTIRAWVPVHLNIVEVAPQPVIGGGFYTGRYEITFEVPFVDDRYAAVGAGRYMVVEHVSRFKFTPAFYTYGGNEKHMEYVSFAFYGTLENE